MNTRAQVDTGQRVFINQMISPTPGLIAQLRGTPTTKRYLCATVFVDHFSGHGYVHLQKSTSADETLEAKKAYETHITTMGVIVSHYHADNGVFADNKFRNAVKEKQQTLSFCGVNAHFQNGKAEKRIGDSTGLARTMLTCQSTVAKSSQRTSVAGRTAICHRSHQLHPINNGEQWEISTADCLQYRRRCKCQTLGSFRMPHERARK